MRVVLNRAFEESIGPDGVRAYVDALAATGDEAGDHSADELADRLHGRLDAAGIPAPEVSHGRTAEQLIQANGRLVVVSADGSVLHGEEDPADARVDRGDGPGALEPEHPDRPFYS